MAGCCDPSGYPRIFSKRYAALLARRYRKRGLDRAARRMVGFLEREGIEGASVLEIGGGVGNLQLELLRRGAARATNLELVEEYDAAAAELASEAGLVDRVERRVVDIAAAPDAVEPADVVVLHRVVCCYPDYERLLGAAADHARRLLVFSHPPRNVLSRSLLGVQNTFLRMTGRSFRAFAHPPEAMLAVLARSGMEPSYRRRAPVWQVVGLERA
ncbi:MAG TPA: methyltransferase domain-containing protein, partial [Nocardioidaceae bacterium]